jgi:hypothetical protein
VAEQVGTIEFPREWKLGKDWLPGFPQVVVTSEQDNAIVAGGVLEDGTNLLGMCWPGGQRVLRASPDTGWAIEERFDGTPSERLITAWRIVVDCQIKGARDAWAELGGRPGAAASRDDRGGA